MSAADGQESVIKYIYNIKCINYDIMNSCCSFLILFNNEIKRKASERKVPARYSHHHVPIWGIALCNYILHNSEPNLYGIF